MSPGSALPLGNIQRPLPRGFDQQELDRASADPVADRSDLFALAYFDYLRKSNAVGERLTVQNN
jgi:hypothetical protein